MKHIVVLALAISLLGTSGCVVVGRPRPAPVVVAPAPVVVRPAPVVVRPAPVVVRPAPVVVVPPPPPPRR